MVRIISAAGALALALVASPAIAEQAVATGGVVTGLTQGGSAAATGTRYAGNANGLLGAIVGGIGGTFDAFGFYNSGVGALTLTRQTDLLSGNVYRFYDTFTNLTGARIQTTVSFFGNLGSDGDELVQTPQPGLTVSCQGDYDTLSFCDEDAVVALVSSNVGIGRAAITPDRYTVRFDLNLGAGESVALLNFAYLAMEPGGPTDADVTRAIASGLALQASPRLEGLSAEQLGRIGNFAVPEPSTWAMMLLGFAMVAGGCRYRWRATRIVFA